MFLNKNKFIESIFQLFEDAEKELVLIVPYIKMSTEIFDAIKKCDKRSVQVLIVCRKDCITSTELSKLKQLKNLTLLSHPNLHSKIYLNEKHIIIGSMNLYEYSEKFNREAGLKISASEFWDDSTSEECKVEIKEIISGSQEIILSKYVAANGLNYQSIASKIEKLEEENRVLNQMFITKNFKLLETDEGLYPTCISYYDNVDVVISNRITIFPKYPDFVNNKIFSIYNKVKEDKFPSFRFYSNSYKEHFTLYAEKGYSISDYVYVDRNYVKEIDRIITSFCEELENIHKTISR